jgi:hypothetical protein
LELEADEMLLLAKILDNHPDPVDCLDVDSSLFPPLEILMRWMDTLSARGVIELVMFDMVSPLAPDVATVEFLVSYLHTTTLARLALGFVNVTFGRCSGFSELEALFLVCYSCSAMPEATDLKVWYPSHPQHSV